MKKNLKIILYCCVFVPVLIALINLLGKNSRCVTYDEFLKLTLNGVVINKYIDSSQHSFETVEIKNLNDSEVNKIILDLDTTDLFDKISVYDTIFKEENKDSVFVMKGKQKYFLTKVDFGCVR